MSVPEAEFLTERRVHEHIAEIVDRSGRVLKGKQEQTMLALCCLFAGGHLLIEDLPGMGKTTLSQVLARLLSLEFKRVQFTSDLLPADIIGCSVYDSDTAAFTFHQGPVFTQLLLADEINRASPRTQSALLEAMAEKQVSVEGITRALPKPFFVIATQNPGDMAGTYSLPESQLDRFMMSLALGYPDAENERDLLQNGNHPDAVSGLQPVMSASDLDLVAVQSRKVHCSEALLDYLQRLIKATREHAQLRNGLSPRGALALVGCARTWAFMHGRQHVMPEDVQAVFMAVSRHRVTSHHGVDLQQNDTVLSEILSVTEVL
jgi:MoxR-like ATPase